MKGVKGKLVKTLKSIPIVLQVKPQDRLVLHVNASDGYFENIPNVSVFKFHKQTEQEDNIVIKCTSTLSREQQPDVIDVDELMRDLLTDDSDDDNKENITPRKGPVASVESTLKQSKSEAITLPETPLSEIDISSFRRPDLDSSTLFDPGLLAAFRKAVIEYMKLDEAERKSRREIQNDIDNNETEAEPPEPVSGDPLLAFEEKRPPGSFESVILYTTSLRGIRKTFDECNSIRFLLESFRVVYFERDVSMDMEFRQELWNILDCKSVPPKLFIKGRYIGGAEEVLALHEQGKLRPLLAGVPLDQSDGPCQGCAGVRFVVCFKCSGSHKLIADEGESNVCPQCNENGLIICPYCC